MPLWLFRQRAIGVSTLGGLLLGCALYGQSTFLPPFIQGVMGATPTISLDNFTIRQVAKTAPVLASGDPVAMTGLRQY